MKFEAVANPKSVASLKMIPGARAHASSASARKSHVSEYLSSIRSFATR